MLSKAEEKAIEKAANGKYIKFHTRYHWILTWLEEQPGKNLADKVWGVIDRAYRADYAERGREAMRRYRACGPEDLGGQLDAIAEAMGFYSRAGDGEKYKELHRLIWAVGQRKIERDGVLV